MIVDILVGGMIVNVEHFGEVRPGEGLPVHYHVLWSACASLTPEDGEVGALGYLNGVGVALGEGVEARDDVTTRDSGRVAVEVSKRRARENSIEAVPLGPGRGDNKTAVELPKVASGDPQVGALGN